MRFRKDTIIGVGLIGGSIGLALKKRRLAKEVVGVFRRRSTLTKAMRRRAVDHGTFDLERGVSGADMVIIATNVGTIPGFARRAARFMKEGSILTDVGSVKEDIVNKIEGFLPEGVSFVGAHPMAGGEKASVAFASAGLFKGTNVILTSTKDTDKGALRKVSKFWLSLGARISIMDPRTHDKKVSMVSHLPHMAAVALCLAQEKDGLVYAANGFRDTTRIASSDPAMWLDILRDNREFSIRALDKLIVDLNDIRMALARKGFRRLLANLKKAKSIRDGV